MTNHPPLPHLLLVAIAPEITTKSRRTRRRFHDRLTRNLREALRSAGIRSRVEDRWGRILVEVDDPAAAARLAKVFGVASVATVEARVPADLSEIVRAGTGLFADRVRGRKFAVRARRTGAFAFGTHDICVELGAALNPGATVDLDDPEITVHVELRNGEAFLYGDRLPAVGGLPIGTQGQVVCLLSGGFDSAVAAWLMLKRGVIVEYVFCNLGGEAYERSVAGVAKLLSDQWSFGSRPRLHVVDFEAVLEDLQRTVPPRYWQVVLKRQMYRAATQIAVSLDAAAIATGESIGQVSSQTLANLRAIDEVTDLPVLRPLVGYDKREIIALAERIGTAPLSARIREYCAITPDHPVTQTRGALVRKAEAGLDLGVLDAAVAARRELDLKALRDVDLVAPYIFTAEVPSRAVVLDCREPHQYGAWHYPGARLVGEGDRPGEKLELDKRQLYVLYCDVGVRSAYLAEALQREGYEVYSFQGGARGLRRYLEHRGRLPQESITRHNP